jgi:pimeloyl-ACP methyl ester carboxylesterase
VDRLEPFLVVCVVAGLVACGPQPPPEGPATTTDDAGVSEPPAPPPLEQGRTAEGLRFLRRGDFSGTISPLVLLHGNFDAVETWEPLLAELPPSLPVVALELPGYGESSPPLGYTPEQFVAPLSAALTELGLPPVALAGHSLGGIVAGYLARLHPAQVARVAMIDGGFIDPLERPDVLQMIGEVLALVGGLAPDAPAPAELRELVRKVLLDAAAKEEVVTDELVEAFVGRVRASVPAVVGLAQANWDTAVIPGELPVVCVEGWLDRWVSTAGCEVAAEWGVERAGEREFFFLNDSGHMPQLEQPADLARILVAFVGFEPPADLPMCIGDGPIVPREHPMYGHLIVSVFGRKPPPASCGGNDQGEWTPELRPGGPPTTP